MSEGADEAEEVEMPDEDDEGEISDESDESLDEDFFNPNVDESDESLDEDFFNPNVDESDESLDEDFFNPNADESDESLDEDFFNPNVDESDENFDEDFFNPNVDEKDERFEEEFFNPNVDEKDERFEEEFFNPNVGESDERFDEEFFDPNVGESDERFDEDFFDPNVGESDERFDEDFFNPNVDESDESLDEQPCEESDYDNEGEIDPHITDNDLEFDPSSDNDVDEIVGEVHEELRGEEKNSEEGAEERNSSVERENIGTDQSTLILQQESQEPFSRDKEGNIILDAETMEFFGDHVSSQEEMEVEILEEEMEALFNSYEEHGLEQEQGLMTSDVLEQESIQEQQELEQEIYRQQQEEKINQKMEQKLSQELSQKSQKEISQTPKKNNYEKMELIREHDEIENVQESSQKRIQEIKREFAQEEELSKEQSQEIEQEPIREAHQNVDVVQEEAQEQIEEQKKPSLKESDIKEQYKQETGRRPIYGGKETRGFIEWKEYLKQQKEGQVEKNKLLLEKEKETKEHSKEIRESREKWAQYLAKNIKEAEVSEDVKEELNKFLEKYEELRELLEKLKTKEISEEEFEKEVNKFEHILIEKSYIARPLFMNFDWFRRYYNEMIRKSGKRVAHLYISKKTKEFLSYISERIEQLENRGNLYESAKQLEEFLETSFQIREKWALQLNNLIHEVPNKEISKEAKEELETVIKRFCEIRAILFNKNILKEDKEKLIQGRLEKCNPRFFELFEILKRFLGIYDNYSRSWMEQSLISEGKKTVRRLSQKLENIKKENALHQILNEKRYSVQNFKENLKLNLYKITELNMNEKSKIIKIIQNENFDEENKAKLTNILSKLNIEELISLLGEEESKINMQHFTRKVLEILKDFHSLIDGTKEQKELIWSRSIEILDDYISRAKNNVFNIPKNINLKLIVAAIVYTAVISNKNMPRISMVQMSEIVKVNSSSLGKYYRKYFKDFYSKADFLLSVYRLGRIRNFISLYFFEKLKDDIDFKTFDLVMSLKKNVLTNVKLPTQCTQEDINTLNEIITEYQDKFIKYFSDLVEIVRNLIILSITHKKIRALLSLNSLVEYLRGRNINLLQRGKLYNSIESIFNFLKEKFPNFFPIRWGDRENLPKKEKEKRNREYRRIISSRLKLYILKNIYNGKYYEDGIIKCPECIKEGFEYNINNLRLRALDCHHDSAEKENVFKSDNLFLLFNQNRGNPNVLEDLINLLESERILLLCRNHHRRLHFNDEFDYIINWKELFSLPAELIHLLVKVSIKYFRLTKNLSPNEKAGKKKNILRKIKKRYIIENFYGEFCHICGEFSIRKDLSAFDFHHQHKDLRNIKAHELYDTHSCPEIVKILIQEKGGYLCSNCHAVIEYKLIHLLNDIYEDKNIVKKILNDYNSTHRRFTLMNNLSDFVIKAPLKKSLLINKTFERYLTAIYEISKSKNEVTISDLASFTRLKPVTIYKFFKKNSSLLKQSIEMKIGGAPTPTRFVLTEKGREFVSLLYHFKNYYSSL